MDLGLTKKQLAKRLGVDKSTIYCWETNRAKPAYTSLPRVIRFLHGA